MLKIGYFSKLSRVSIRMLRHYDEIDLLKPVKIDEYTGYRYYSEEQLPVMARIISLKDMGFKLTVIKEILKCYDNKEEMEQYLRIRYAELMAVSEETARRLRILETAIDRLRKDDTMNYDVVLKTLPERQVASVRQVIPCYEQEGRLWHILFKETNHLNLILQEPCFMSAILHDKEYKEVDVDVEVQAAVKGCYLDTEHVKFKTEPEVTVASITFKGPYEQFRDVYSSLAAWVDVNGYQFSGPMFDIYHVSPHETKNPEEFITEVCCPVQKK
ncbi:MAG: MerR family transcriptional regulator [Lachnospiraceae bacterium]|nr:MerR family transcriptional regulator [Lachnospiraceae bacterium]